MLAPEAGFVNLRYGRSGDLRYFCTSDPATRVNISEPNWGSGSSLNASVTRWVWIGA